MKSFMHIHCNFKSTEALFAEKLKKMENTGYLGVRDPELIQATVAAIRRREVKSKVKYHEDKNNYPKIAKALEKAAQGAKKRARRGRP